MADDNEVSIKVSVDPGSSKQNLDTLKDSFSAVENAARKWAETLGAGDGTGAEAMARYSDMTARLGELRAQLIETYGSFGAIPPEALARLQSFSEAIGGVRDAFTLAESNATKFDASIASGNIRAVTTDYLKLKNSVDALESSLLDVYGTMSNVPQEQLAHYNRLSTALTDAQKRTQTFRDETDKARLAVRDSGPQVQAFGQIIQQLGSVVGGAGEKLGQFGGQAGLLAGAADNLHDAFQSLNLNTIGGDAAKLGIQLGLVAAVLATASEAGIKLAETNEANKDSIENFEKSVKSFLGAEGESWKEWLAEVQAGLQVLIERTILAGDAIESVVSDAATGKYDKLREDIGRLKDAYADIGKEADAAAAAAKRQVTQAEFARRAIAEETAELNKQVTAFARVTSAYDVYRLLQSTGAAGQKVWNDLHLTSNMTLEEMSKRFAAAGISLEDFIKKVQASARATDEATDAHRRAVGALKSELTAQEDLAAATKRSADEYGTAADHTKKLEAALAETQRRISALDIATKGHTATLDAEYAVLGNLLKSYETSGPAIKILVDEITKAKDATAGLTDEQQRQIDKLGEAQKTFESLENKRKAILESVAEIEKKAFDQWTKDEYEKVIKARDDAAEIEAQAVSLREKQKALAQEQIAEAQKVAEAEKAAYEERFTTAKAAVEKTQQALDEAKEKERRAIEEKKTGYAELYKMIVEQAQKAADEAAEAFKKAQVGDAANDPTYKAQQQLSQMILSITDDTIKQVKDKWNAAYEELAKASTTVKQQEASIRSLGTAWDDVTAKAAHYGDVVQRATAPAVHGEVSGTAAAGPAAAGVSGSF